MAQDIGARLKVEGESSYAKAFRDAAKVTKTLNAELKTAEAQFKASGDAEELMAKRGKLLQEELNAQEKAAQTARTMLEQLAKAGYDQNSAKVLQWRQNLANAETKIIQLNSAIQNNAQGLDEAGKAYASLGEDMQQAAQDADNAKSYFDESKGSADGLRESVGGIGAAIGIQGITESLSSINKAIDSVISKVKEMATALWQAEVDASNWADELLTNSVVWGIDTKTLQQWSYASLFIDTEVSTIVAARKRLIKGMNSSSADMAANFNALGVPTRTAEGELRSVDDVFWDVIRSLGQMDNATKREGLAMEVLGKSADELNPIIQAGREEWEKYANMAPIVGDDQVNALGSFNDAMNKMNAELEALKLDVLGSLAPVFEEIATQAAAGAKALREYLQTDEGKALLEDIQEAIRNLAAAFTEQDIGKLIRDAAESAGGLIQSFADLVKDKDGVVKAIEGIGIAIGALKLGEAASKAAALVASLKIATALRTGQTPGVPATPTTTTAVGGGVGNTLRTAGTTVLNAASTVLPTVAGGALFLGTTYKIAEAADRAATDAHNAEADAARQLAEDTEKATDGTQDLSEALRILTQIYDEDLGADAFGQLDLARLRQVAPNAALWDKLDAYGGVEGWLGSGEAIGAQAWSLAENLIGGITEYIEDHKGEASDAASSMMSEAVDAGDAAIGNAPFVIGGNVSIGLANGIDSEADKAIQAANSLAEGVTSILSSSLQVQSPSRLTRQIGEYVGEGLALGMSGSESMVTAAAAQMMAGMPSVIGERAGVVVRAAETQTQAVQAAGAGGASVPGAILAALSGMRVEIDGHEAGRVILPTIESLMAEETMSRRYA